MDRDQFMHKYGNVLLTFTGYYKFVFSFEGATAEGHRVTAHIGGTADEIYKLDVSELAIRLGALDPSRAAVYDEDVLVASYSDE